MLSHTTTAGIAAVQRRTTSLPLRRPLSRHGSRHRPDALLLLRHQTGYRPQHARQDSLPARGVRNIPLGHLHHGARTVQTREFGRKRSFNAHREWFGAKFQWNRYFDLPGCKWFSFGFNIDAVWTTHPRFQTETATLMSLPAYQPVVHSQMAFMPDYRAKNFLAGGLMPTFDLLPNFFLRTGFMPCTATTGGCPAKRCNTSPKLVRLSHAHRTGQPVAHQIRPEELAQYVPHFQFRLRDLRSQRAFLLIISQSPYSRKAVRKASGKNSNGSNRKQKIRLAA